MKNILISLLLVLCLFLSLSGCSNFWYDVPSEFIEVGVYEALKGNDSLGHPDGKMLDNIYTLKGLPQSDYLLRTRGSFWGESSSTGFLLMNKNVEEPLFRYSDDISKIEINVKQQNEDGIVVAEAKATVIDHQIISDLLLIRINGDPIEWDDNTYISEKGNVSFYFNFPCELIWRSTLYFDGNTIKWLCEDVKSGERKCFDVTTVLSNILKNER